MMPLQWQLQAMDNLYKPIAWLYKTSTILFYNHSKPLLNLQSLYILDRYIYKGTGHVFWAKTTDFVLKSNTKKTIIFLIIDVYNFLFLSTVNFPFSNFIGTMAALVKNGLSIRSPLGLPNIGLHHFPSLSLKKLLCPPPVTTV